MKSPLRFHGFDLLDGAMLFILSGVLVAIDGLFRHSVEGELVSIFSARERGIVAGLAIVSSLYLKNHFFPKAESEIPPDGRVSLLGLVSVLFLCVGLSLSFVGFRAFFDWQNFEPAQVSPQEIEFRLAERLENEELQHQLGVLATAQRENLTPEQVAQAEVISADQLSDMIKQGATAHVAAEKDQIRAELAAEMMSELAEEQDKRLTRLRKNAQLYLPLGLGLLLLAAVFEKTLRRLFRTKKSRV